MTPADLNRLSWEIAAESMIESKGKIAPYSTSQLRKFFQLVHLEEPELRRAIEESRTSYNPQPVQRRDRTTPRELQMKRSTHGRVCDLLLRHLPGMNKEDRLRLMQYVMWNASIVEMIQKETKKEREKEKEGNRKRMTQILPLLFGAERLSNGGELMVRLLKKYETMHSTKSVDIRGTGNRFRRRA